MANMGLIRGRKGIEVPEYDRSSISPGVVNLGLRDFHRVHSATYFDKLLHMPSNKSWGIVNVALSAPQRKAVQELKVQNSLYTVVEKNSTGLPDLRVIGSVLDCMSSADDSLAVSALIGSNSTRIVMLTLKESNYFFLPDFSRLNHNDPHIRLDMLSGPNKPQKTPVGMLVLGLYQRFKNKGHPLTVLSCENIMRNGELARAMVEQYALLRYPMDPEFHRWLSTSVFYPNTMCDRICLTDPSEDRISLQQEFGIRDNALLTTESFSEWIVEKWMGDKPEGMNNVGIKMVPSTVPYENLKIRLNYGSRLSVGILAHALGHETFEAAMGDDTIAKFAKKFMDEVSGGLGALPKDVNIEEYKDHTMERMKTPGLKYVTHRVTESASKKVRIDWQPVLDSLPEDAPVPIMGATVAVWAHLLANSRLCKTDQIALIDPNASELEPLAKAMIASARNANSQASCKMFLAATFAQNTKFTDRLVEATLSSLNGIEKNGIAGEIKRIVN